MEIQWNEEGLKAILKEAAAKIANMDAAFRATHEGYPVEVVAADVPAAFPGVQLPDAAVLDYASAVSKGEPFQFVLEG